MANISLTSTCNRSCSFCFAGDSMDASSASAKYIALDRFESTLDFLERSGIREARLLGGEPTVHPEFEEIVDRVRARGLNLVVFSGGLIPEKALRKLESVPHPELAVLLNVIAPETGRPQELARQEEVMRRLGRRIMLGVTIDSPAVRIGFLLDFIERFDLMRAVRLGLGHPALNGSNSYLHPRHYPEVGRRVTEFGFAAQQRGVQIDFDCGWVPCMFPEGALAALGKGSGDVGLRCNPILDIMPDGQVISCYPLATHAETPLSDHRDARAIRLHFTGRQSADRRFMLYRECEACAWRARGECTGGCLSASLGRLRQRDFTVAVPEAVQ